jgi:LPXTG-motif cell wall-anchored protein
MQKVFFYISLSFFICLFFLFPKGAYATTYDLLAPEGVLTMGQIVTFTINIDSQGASITNAEIGMTYDTQYLEFQNITPGDAFPTVTATPASGGKLVISASSSSGYNGAGTFALVNFKLIAQAPGSTEICTLWAPSTSPTPQSATPTTSPNQPTTPPLPTRLPTTGINKPFIYASSVGIIVTLAASGLFLISKRKK